jgi:hypothetical protein
MINAQIKYRERWRPFCPLMLDVGAAEILQSKHPSPYMTFTFDVADSWKPSEARRGCRLPQPRVRQSSPPIAVFLTSEFCLLTSSSCISLNRRGEPMICSPDDALNMVATGKDCRVSSDSAMEAICRIWGLGIFWRGNQVECLRKTFGRAIGAVGRPAPNKNNGSHPPPLDDKLRVSRNNWATQTFRLFGGSAFQ